MKDYTLEKRKYVIGAAAIVIVLIYVFRLFDPVSYTHLTLPTTSRV